MAYAFEKPDGGLILTKEMSRFDDEQAAFEIIKANAHWKDRKYDPDTKQWHIIPQHAAMAQQAFITAGQIIDDGVWLAWLTQSYFHLIISKPNTEPQIIPFVPSDDDDAKSCWRVYRDVMAGIDAGWLGPQIAAYVLEETTLLATLASANAKAMNNQLALEIAAAAGTPPPRTKAKPPKPKPPVLEEGQLPVAHMTLVKSLGGHEIRFSLIQSPNDFCGRMPHDLLVVWTEAKEAELEAQLRIPPAINVYSHFTALGLVYDPLITPEDQTFEMGKGRPKPFGPTCLPSRAEIRKAFAARSLIYHPDHNGAVNAAAMFAPIQAAWEFFKRVEADPNGRVLKLYLATLKIKMDQDGEPRKWIEAEAPQHIRARWMGENIQSGLLAGQWLRDVNTGKIVVKRLDNIAPLKDSRGWIWQPTSADRGSRLAGTWAESNVWPSAIQMEEEATHGSHMAKAFEDPPDDWNLVDTDDEGYATHVYPNYVRD